MMIFEAIEDQLIWAFSGQFIAYGTMDFREPRCGCEG